MAKKVFVSYAHSRRSEMRVRHLVAEFRSKGLEVSVDLDFEESVIGPQNGWPNWMLQEIARADYVLMMCDALYKARVEGNPDTVETRGARWEGVIISNQLYDSQGKNRKFVALLDDDDTGNNIPGFLPRGNYYRIPSETRILADKLIDEEPIERTDFERLPVPTTRLIGRDKYTDELNTALTDEAIGVVGIIADGGVGKSALIYEWLYQLDTSAFDRGYGWSFSDAALNTEVTSVGFFNACFHFFGIEQPSADDYKARRLLQWLNMGKGIMVLDGIEGLQIPHGEAVGRISNDRALRELLTRAASRPHGYENRLIVVTSRLPLTDLKGRPAYKRIELPHLSRSESAELLESLGVIGRRQELQKAGTECDGHGLSLVLLGSILVNRFHGDIGQRDLIWSLVPPSPTGSCAHQARCIMAYYDRVIAEPHDRLFLQMMGLFHRAMTLEQKNYLISKEPFKTYLRDVTYDQWAAMENRLKAYGLLAPQRESDRHQAYTKWNCHPLVREHFREVFQRNRPEDFCAAQKVLFEYFTKAPQPPVGTPQRALLPFYRAIHHGCQAGLYGEAIKVYKEKLLRNDAQAEATNRLGMISEDIAALRRFFGENIDIASDVPVEDIDFLWGRMAFCLTCQGLLDEAVMYRRRELDFFEGRKEPMGISGAKENLSGLYLMQGQLTLAVEEAQSALAIAKEGARDWGKAMRAWSRIGAAHYFRGEMRNSKEAFEEAERLQRSGDPTRPWMHSDYGIYYRLYKLDVAGTDSDYKDVLDEASGAMEHGDDRFWLVPSGFDALVTAVAFWRLGRISTARNRFYEAKNMLESSGALVYLPLYLLPLTSFHLECNDIEEAKTQVDEAERIATEYRLPLVSIDVELARARIAIKEESDEEADALIESARNSVSDYSYNLRWADIALLEAELAVLRRDRDRDRRIRGAERLIRDSTRSSLLTRIEALIL